MKRNWEALVLRAMGGRTFRLTLLDNQPVNQWYRRLHVDGGELLATCGIHPTMWIRLWFDRDGHPHQRAYTVVDPDPDTGRFHLEFALHDGCAADWSRHARAGDTIDATVQGSRFALPEPPPAHLYLVGDPAALPAVNSLLDAAADIPVTVWLEYIHDEEVTLPVRQRPDDTVTWVPRRDAGTHLVDTVCAALPAADDAYYWIACEAASTRSLARHARRTLGIDKHRVHALGYWSAPR